jgi:DNA helicase HerA-like ATPase
MDNLAKYEKPDPNAITQQAENLPLLLLSYLERKFFEDFNSYSFQFADHQGGEPKMESRFIEIKEVKHTSNLDHSFHAYNMQNVVSSLSNGGHSLLYMLKNSKNSTKLYMGTRQLDRNANDPEHQIDVLARALGSNYPGIVLTSDAVEKTKLDNLPITRDLIDNAIIPLSEASHFFAVTGIPSLRGSTLPKYNFSQSIDRLVDALRGEEYTLLVLAEPIPEMRISQMLEKLYKLSSDVHLLVQRSIQMSEGVSFSDSVSISSGLAFFLSMSAGKSKGEARSSNKTVIQNVLNKAAEACENFLNQYQTRLQAGRNYGFWTTGVFVGSNDQSTIIRLQSIVRSIYAGDQTHFEPLRLVDISSSHKAKDAIYFLQNPIIQEGNEFIGHPLGNEFDTLATPLTTEEVAILMSLPNREVPGLKISEVADFNLNPPTIDGIKLGNLLYRGETLPTSVSISSQSLTRHTFVTGITGSGKTNSCLALLKDAYQKQGKNFLVIDPAKTEYRLLLQDSEDKELSQLGKDLLIFTLGDENSAPFRLNPFDFEPGFPILAHIDLLKSVFNAAFPMYATMPMILEEAILDVYKARGWNLTNSTNRFIKGNLKDHDYTQYLPRLGDLYARIDTVVKRKGYDERLRHDLTAALKTRLGSLMNGGKGKMLDCQDSISISELLDHPVILELRRVSDDDEKAFLMALLFIRLYEAVQNRPPDGVLKHVTLLEEAHRLLRNSSTSANSEAANPRGKTIEMFTDMMAEMRAHGEGIVVVDQIPSKLVPDVIKGSNLKIVHRLLAEDDRLAVGNAMGLNPDQIKYLPRLTVGQAVLHSEELGDACFVKIDSVESELFAKNNDSPDMLHHRLNDLVCNRFHEFTSVERNKKIYRRFPVCTRCDNPCWYTPENNRWQNRDAVVILVQQLVSAIVVGDLGIVPGMLHKTQTMIEHILISRYGRPPESGETHCAYVHLVRQTSFWVSRYHRRKTNPATFLGFQKLLIDILSQDPVEEKQLLRPLVEDAKNNLRENIMLHPGKEMPGCRFCRVPCYFGHIFQYGNRAPVKALMQEIEKQKNVGKTPVYTSGGKLSAQVQRFIRAELGPDLLDDAAYCWVVNSATHRANFSYFWENKISNQQGK